MPLAILVGVLSVVGAIALTVYILGLSPDA